MPRVLQQRWDIPKAVTETCISSFPPARVLESPTDPALLNSSWGSASPLSEECQDDPAGRAPTDPWPSPIATSAATGDADTHQVPGTLQKLCARRFFLAPSSSLTLSAAQGGNKGCRNRKETGSTHRPERVSCWRYGRAFALEMISCGREDGSMRWNMGAFFCIGERKKLSL